VTNSRRRQHTKQLGCRDPVPKWAKSNKWATRTNCSTSHR
jgi:hypothetical protein